MNNPQQMYGIFQVWLGNFVTADQGWEAMQLRNVPRKHPRFFYPYTRQGQRGLLRLNTLSEQAYCQKLAHMGCIPASLLLGYSLTREYGDTGRVICEISGYQYAFLGIEAILQHYTEPGFYEEVQLFFGDSLLLDICWYLLRSYEPLGLDHGDLPVMQFCRMITSDSLNCPRLDS
jgi:hypothetical protein